MAPEVVNLALRGSPGMTSFLFVSKHSAKQHRSAGVFSNQFSPDLVGLNYPYQY